MRRPRLSRLLSAHPASCICFRFGGFSVFWFSVVALIFEHESHHPDTQEKERDHRPAARRRLIARKLACVLSISGIDVLIHLSCRHWRSSGRTSCRKISGTLQKERRRGESFFFLFVQLIVETIPAQAAFYFKGKSSFRNVLFDPQF